MSEEQKDKKLAAQIRANVATYVTAAFGLVAGLAWNDAVTALIEEIFPLSRATIVAKFLYAAILTVVLVLATVALMRFLKKIDRSA